MVEPLLLTATQVSTFAGAHLLTKASGFFFARDDRLFLVTSRHVLADAPTFHFPDRIEIELHVDAEDLARSVSYSVLLHRDEQPIWRQASDEAGEVDVATIELDRTVFPEGAVLQAFTPEHLQDSFDDIEVGSPLLIVGFPLGFHDTLHHLPVVRQAMIATSFGLRFQGLGCFLTDARTHRGTSGAAVVMRDPAAAGADGALPWRLIGVHSATMDMHPRAVGDDESLGLNCAWYAGYLLALTDGEPPPAPTARSTA